MPNTTPFEDELRSIFEKLPYDEQTTKNVDPSIGEVRLINFNILKQIVENYMTAAYANGVEAVTSSTPY